MNVLPLAARLVLSLLLALGAASMSHAQDEEPTKPKTRRVLSVGKKTFERLNKAHEALGEENFGGALAQMNELAKSSKLNAHEKALMHQTYGYIYSGQENYRKAAASFEKAIATGELSPAAEVSTQYNLGQLYMATEQYRKAIDTLNAWFQVAENPQPDPYFLLAQAYVQADDTKNALRWAKKGLAKAPKPREDWLQLTLALYFEQKDYRNVVEMLEQLVARFPNKRYWLQLYAAYGELGDERKAHAAFELAHEQGFLTTDNELRQLAQLHLYHGAPYKAARVLEQEMDGGRVSADSSSLELLANSWIAAREYQKALAPLERAAKLSDNGKLWMRLGQVHMENESWAKAAESLRAGIAKGGLDDAGQAHLLVGVCNINLKQAKAARAAFQSAAKYNGSRDSARQWLRHLDTEAAARAEN